jgi:hypothetical protein
MPWSGAPSKPWAALASPRAPPETLTPAELVAPASAFRRFWR